VARIRTIKPDFWTDSKTGTLSDKATKVFIGTWNHADDYGVLEFDIIALKAKIYPYSPEDHISLIAKPLFDELLPKGLLILFAYSENEEPPFRPYLFIKNFPKHQKVDKPGKPLIPGWNKNMTPQTFDPNHVAFPPDSPINQGTIDDYSENVRRAFAVGLSSRKGSSSRKGKERKGIGKEGKGTGEGKLSASDGADDGGNAEGHPPVAPTLSVDPEVVKLGEIIKRRQAEGIPH
jgi:hypothetical protein